MIDGFYYYVFGHMDAAAVWVVVDDHITWLDVFGSNFGNQPLNDKTNCSNLSRAKLGLCQHSPIAVEQNAGKVSALAKNWRVGGPHHGGSHLATDSNQTVVNHVQRDWVSCDLGDRRARVVFWFHSDQLIRMLFHAAASILFNLEHPVVGDEGG